MLNEKYRGVPEASPPASPETGLVVRQQVLALTLIPIVRFVVPDGRPERRGAHQAAQRGCQKVRLCDSQIALFYEYYMHILSIS